MKSKKGAITLYLLVIALIISTSYILMYTAPTQDEVKFVGATQQKLLISQEIKNQAINFLDMTTTLAKEKTIQDLNENSGFEKTEFLEEFPCKRAVYPVINEGEKITCFPEYNKSINTQFQINFDNMLHQNPDVLFSPTHLEISTTTNKEDIQLEVTTTKAVAIPIYQSFSNYYDEKIKSLIGAGMPRYSYEEQRLVAIENIDNIICDETDTDFGKRCAGNQELINALKKLSKEYLVPEEKTMIITQAFRTYAIQKALYDYIIKEKGRKFGCNPDANNKCPHMIAGAIDMNIKDKNGNLLNNAKASQESKQKIVEDMCKFGFVNYEPEAWHYEYGTPKWEDAMKKRQKGERACQYPFT